MKVIIIEGPDNTGKNTIINNLVENNEVVKIIHCSTPKTDNPFAEQCMQFGEYTNMCVDEYLDESENVLIFNRYYQGEYVYGQLYREESEENIKAMIDILEEKLLENIDPEDIYYIQLLSSSAKLLKKNDDKKSLSGAKLKLIKQEIQLFTDVFNYSKIKNKKIIYINNGDEFRTREDILNEALEFIKGKN